MKIRKNLTAAKLAANKRNAQRSTGPKSDRGKVYAKNGALTHGFFARELILTYEESRQLEASRRCLHSQLRPRTELQVCGLEEIKACMGRCKLALRLEMRHISRILGQDNEQQPQPDKPSGAGGRPEWYLSGKQGLREARRILEDVKQEFLRSGRIDEKWNSLLDEAFGPGLRQQLVQWIPPAGARPCWRISC